MTSFTSLMPPKSCASGRPRCAPDFDTDAPSSCPRCIELLKLEDEELPSEWNSAWWVEDPPSWLLKCQ